MVINMKKSIISGLLALTLLLSFTACSDNKQDGQNTPDSSQTAQAAQLEKTDFSLGHLNSTAHLLAFVAAEEGYFK